VYPVIDEPPVAPAVNGTVACVLPPVAVGLHTDWESTPVLINIILWFLGVIPGIAHAFYVILT
jgi:uncharacterized membrane protein YqaE (UPF0057 family)